MMIAASDATSAQTGIENNTDVPVLAVVEGGYELGLYILHRSDSIQNFTSCFFFSISSASHVYRRLVA